MDIGLAVDRDIGVTGHIGHFVQIKTTEYGKINGQLLNFDKCGRRFELEFVRLEDHDNEFLGYYTTSELDVRGKLQCMTCKMSKENTPVASPVPPVSLKVDDAKEANITLQQPNLSTPSPISVAEDDDDDDKSTLTIKTDTKSITEQIIGVKYEPNATKFSEDSTEDPFDDQKEWGTNLVDPEEYRRDQERFLSREPLEEVIFQAPDVFVEEAADTSSDSGLNGSINEQDIRDKLLEEEDIPPLPSIDGVSEPNIIFIANNETEEFVLAMEIISSSPNIGVFIPGKLSRDDKIEIISISLAFECNNYLFVFKIDQPIGLALKSILEAPFPRKIMINCEDYSNALKYRLDVTLKKNVDDPKVVDWHIRRREQQERHMYSSYRIKNLNFRTLEDLLEVHFPDFYKFLNGQYFRNYMSPDEDNVLLSCLTAHGGNDKLTTAAVNFLKRKTLYLLPLMDIVWDKYTNPYTSSIDTMLRSKRDISDDDLMKIEFDQKINRDPMIGVFYNAQERMESTKNDLAKILESICLQESDDNVAYNDHLKNEIEEHLKKKKWLCGLRVPNSNPLRKRRPSNESIETYVTAKTSLSDSSSSPPNESLQSGSSRVSLSPRTELASNILHLYGSPSETNMWGTTSQPSTITPCGHQSTVAMMTTQHPHVWDCTSYTKHPKLGLRLKLKKGG